MEIIKIHAKEGRITKIEGVDQLPLNVTFDIMGYVVGETGIPQLNDRKISTLRGHEIFKYAQDNPQFNTFHAERALGVFQ
jgi:hypothetical protein